MREHGSYSKLLGSSSHLLYASHFLSTYSATLCVLCGRVLVLYCFNLMGKVNGGGSREKDTVKARQGCSVMQLLLKKKLLLASLLGIFEKRKGEKKENLLNSLNARLTSSIFISFWYLVDFSIDSIDTIQKIQSIEKLVPFSPLVWNEQNSQVFAKTRHRLFQRNLL